MLRNTAGGVLSLDKISKCFKNIRNKNSPIYLINHVQHQQQFMLFCSSYAFRIGVITAPVEVIFGLFVVI